jgi:hypothetical protein
LIAEIEKMNECGYCPSMPGRLFDWDFLRIGDAVIEVGKTGFRHQKYENAK